MDKIHHNETGQDLETYLEEQSHCPNVHRRTPIAESYHHPNPPEAEPRSDGHILRDIFVRLSKEGEEDPSHLDIRVQQGSVQLFGRVDSQLAKLSIANICDGVDGVIAVENHLEVK
ncbi:MAG: hypothetical protein JWQ35_2341 [Bacteriovoracaceae bacterium]|nr:hypothetical protein [Bacteriovoracaceae bacterium]